MTCNHLFPRLTLVLKEHFVTDAYYRSLKLQQMGTMKLILAHVILCDNIQLIKYHVVPIATCCAFSFSGCYSLHHLNHILLNTIKFKRRFNTTLYNSMISRL